MDAAVTLENLQNPSSAYYAEAKVNKGAGPTGNIRLDAVREAAIGVGVRGGLKARATELNTALESVSRQMDIAYDFKPYVIQGRVLPPVITEARDVYTQGGATSLRLAGRTYRLEAQARFVSRPPTWREYMVMNYEMTLPSPALMPKNDEEDVLWKVAVNEGWKQGIEQADGIFQANYDRLHRDYLGVLRFHKLVAANMVTMPIIAQSKMSITGDKNQVALDEQLLRITALPTFNLAVSDWHLTTGKIQDEPVPQPTPRKPRKSASSDAKNNGKTEAKVAGTSPATEVTQTQ